jgi:hypothetical protein
MRPATLATLAVTAVALLGPGCHAKFKKYAPTLGEVRLQTVTTGAPYVSLGKVYTDNDSLIDLVGTAVNVVQTVKEIDQSDRIARAVDIQKVNAALQAGVQETLGSGPPFAWTDKAQAPAVLQLEILDYGLAVPGLGARGVFTYSMKARIYKADGDRVYSYSMTCDSAAGMPDSVAAALGVVNNVKQLNEMSNAQIQEAFDAMAHWCGSAFVVKMRKHAG